MTMSLPGYGPFRRLSIASGCSGVGVSVGVGTGVGVEVAAGVAVGVFVGAGLGVAVAVAVGGEVGRAVGKAVGERVASSWGTALAQAESASKPMTRLSRLTMWFMQGFYHR
jgi:hypothetical protein